MNQPLARARASGRLSQTAASANTRLRSQPLQTRKRSGTAAPRLLSHLAGRWRTPFQPLETAKRSGTPAPNDPKTTQKRSRLRPENDASECGNESLCPSLGVATAERTRRRKSQKNAFTRASASFNGALTQPTLPNTRTRKHHGAACRVRMCIHPSQVPAPAHHGVGGYVNLS